MENNNTSKVTSQVEFNGDTFSYGAEFVHVNDKNRKGVLMSLDGKPTISFAMKGARKHSPLSDKWQLVENVQSELPTSNPAENTVNLLDAVLEKTTKGKGKSNKSDNSDNPSQSQGDAENDSQTNEATSLVLPKMTAEQKAELKAMENELKRLERGRLQAEEKAVNNTFRQAKIAYRIQSEKLFRETINKATGKPYKKFAEYITDIIGCNRQHAYLLATIGGFTLDFGDLFENDAEIELGIRSARSLVVNHKSLVEKMQLEQMPANEVKPLIEQIIDLDKKVAFDDKKGVALITEKVIDKVAGKVETELSDLFDYGQTDIIDLAVKRLKEKGSFIVENSRKELSEKVKKEEKTYAELTLADFDGFTFEKGVITLKDGRTFREFFQ